MDLAAVVGLVLEDVGQDVVAAVVLDTLAYLMMRKMGDVKLD